MNNASKLLAVFVVAALAFAVLPSSAQNAGTDYGTQVTSSNNEFRPTLEAGADIDVATIGVLRAEGPDATIFTDDVFILDVDQDPAADADDISQYDYILATGGYGGSEVGALVQSGDTALLALAATDRDATVQWADVDENGLYGEGDYVYLTSAACGGIAATAVGAAAGAFTIRLTPNDEGGFGSLVRTTHDDFDDYGADTSCDFDGSAPLDSTAEFAFYDSENDDEFEGGNDRAYIVGPGGVGAGDAVPLFAIVIFGGDMGDQVLIGGQDWSPSVLELVDLDVAAQADSVIRYDPGTPDNAFDDVFVLNLDGDAAGGIEQHDVVLATAGYDGTSVGDVIGLGQTLLVGNGAHIDADVYSADVDQNGFWNTGDYLWICDLGGATIHRSDADEFCIRLTDTNGGDAGSLVRVGDDDLDDYGGGTDDQDAAEACFFDSDADAAFDGGDDRIWIFIDGCADGDLLALYSVALVNGAFGSFVDINDNDFVPALTATGIAVGGIEGDAGEVVRFDAGTNDDFTDDVFALDLDSSETLTQYDLIIASGANYGGRGVGDVVQVGDQLLLGMGVGADVDVYFVDVDEDGIYDEGDWVLICSDLHGFAPTSIAEFCIRMTDTSDGDAGTIVRTSDDDWSRWGGTEMDLDAADIGFYDTDNDGAFQGEGDGDLLFLTPVDIADGSRVPLFSLRLFGDFSIVPGTDPPTTDPPTTDPPTTDPPTTDPPTTDPPTDDPGDDPDDPEPRTPGFELIALVAALGAALVLVRRRL